MDLDAADMAAYLVANTPRLAKLNPRKQRQVELDLARNCARYLTRAIADGIERQKKVEATLDAKIAAKAAPNAPAATA